LAQRRDDQRGFWERFWNEFFFSREFEYETPLTPDEVADVFRERVDGSERQRSWWDTGMQNEVEITRQGDKQQEFVINAIGKGWGSRAVTSRTEGTILANVDDGLTTISGKTAFGRSHYMWIFFIGLTWAIFLAMRLSSGESIGDTLFWLVLFGVYFWYTYRDRNFQVKVLDDAIMNAKPKSIGERLVLTEDKRNHIDDDVNELHVSDQQRASIQPE